MDNRNFRRLIYEVLDHDPSKEDIKQFFNRFKALLEARGLELHGITTDGSPLYPDPIADVFGDIPHQICTFHVIAELTKAVLRVVTQVRRSLKAKMPKLPRGRPTTKRAKRRARRKKRLQEKVTDLFDHRHLFVKRHLTLAQRRTLQEITRGFPNLRALREIMDEVYRLFDRRCSTQTALDKLSKLRKRVRRFKKIGKTLKKLDSPNLEKALNFLDDSLLPPTSNAVERGNRRHRKMQKSIYSVRTLHTLLARMALDHIRDWYMAVNGVLLAVLHKARRSSTRQSTSAPIAIYLQNLAPRAKAG